MPAGLKPDTVQRSAPAPPLTTKSTQPNQHLADLDEVRPHRREDYLPLSRRQRHRLRPGDPTGLQEDFLALLGIPLHQLAEHELAPEFGREALLEVGLGPPAMDSEAGHAREDTPASRQIETGRGQGPRPAGSYLKAARGLAATAAAEEPPDAKRAAAGRATDSGLVEPPLFHSVVPLLHLEPREGPAPAVERGRVLGDQALVPALEDLLPGLQAIVGQAPHRE